MNRQKLIRDLDKVFSKYIKKRDSLGECTQCISCSEFVQTPDAGHYIDRENKTFRWDERNVHAQCQSCNRFTKKEEMLKNYRKGLIYKLGEAEVIRLESSNNYENRMVKIPTYELSEMIKEYKLKLKDERV